MPPTFVLADLYARGAVPGAAFNARPEAPIQPAARRWQRFRRLSESARRPFAPSAGRAPNLERTPAAQYP